MSKGTLAQHRGWANKSQEDVAKALNVSVNTISNYESGKSEPKFTFVVKFSELLSINLSDIIIEPLKVNDNATV